MRTISAIINGGIALVFYATAILLALGYRGSSGNKVTGFAWDGLVTTWWGRGAAAAFAIFVGTLFLLAAKRFLHPKRPGRGNSAL
jgi:hypothetical protein